jgi:hypothetical protein
MSDAKLCMHCTHRIRAREADAVWVNEAGLASCEAGPLGVHQPTESGRLYRCPVCGSWRIWQDVSRELNTGEIGDSGGSYLTCGECGEERKFYSICEVDAQDHCVEHRRPFVLCRLEANDGETPVCVVLRDGRRGEARAHEPDGARVLVALEDLEAEVLVRAADVRTVSEEVPLNPQMEAAGS